MNDTKKAGGKLAKLAKIAGVGLVLLGVAHVVWVNSGSNEWESVSDKDGIRVWSMKTPGEALKKYKVEMRVESDLSDIVFYMSDLQTGYEAGATDIKRLAQVVDAPTVLVYDTYKLDLKAFGQVEVVIVNHYEQDPKTGIVKMNVHAAPHMLQAPPTITRMKHLSNSFMLTPVSGGGTDLQVISQMDLGIPYVLQNLLLPTVSHDEMVKMRNILKGERYRQGKPPFIVDPPLPGAAPAAAPAVAQADAQTDPAAMPATATTPATSSTPAAGATSAAASAPATANAAPAPASSAATQ